RIGYGLEQYHRQFQAYPMPDSVFPNQLPTALTTPMVFLDAPLPREPYYVSQESIRLKNTMLLICLGVFPLFYLILLKLLLPKAMSFSLELLSLVIAAGVFGSFLFYEGIALSMTIPAIIALVLVAFRATGRRQSKGLRFAGTVSVYFLLMVLAVVTTQ